MKTNNELVKLLQSILGAEQSNKVILIKEFQDEVWNDKSVKDQELNEILSELAYDLDFYEPDEKLRKGVLSYYGNYKLEEIIKNAIQKLSYTEKS